MFTQNSKSDKIHKQADNGNNDDNINSKFQNPNDLLLLHGKSFSFG